MRCKGFGTVNAEAVDPGGALLLCGHPKSGTTLLQSLLDGHPEVLVIPEETKYFSKLHRWPWRRRAGYLLEHTRMARFNPAVEGIYDLDYVDWRKFQAGLRAGLSFLPAARDVLPAIGRAYAAASGSENSRWKYWLEKTPGNELYLTDAAEMWPELRAIYLVRDPRDVFTSFRIKRGQRGEALPVDGFCRDWRASLAAWDAFAARSAQAAHGVGYENLVRDPQTELEGVCNFLGIAMTESLRRPTVGSQLWGGNSVHGDVFAGVSVAAIGRYASQLSAEDVRSIEAELGEFFERFGWERASAG
jgi:hypothetical protein